MFFLGLLSTPLPYLLLAAFYFFGFAMGMFNNKTGDEATETVSSITIPAEVKTSAIDHSVYYFQVKKIEKQVHAETIKPEAKTSDFIPDTGPSNLKLRNIIIYEIHISGFLFSRPPPVIG